MGIFSLLYGELLHELYLYFLEFLEIDITYIIGSFKITVPVVFVIVCFLFAVGLGIKLLYWQFRKWKVKGDSS